MTTLAPTLSTRYFPRSTAWMRDAFLVLSGAILVALLAQVRIVLPYTPVPLTGQSFGVLLAGAVLGAKRGTASMTFYTLLGALGLPVFAGGAAGMMYLTSPTLGYLIGFVVAAFVIGKLAERGLERNLRTSLLPFLLGTLVIYAFGAGWLALLFGVKKALLLGVFPFILGDIIKLVLAALILPSAWKLVR